MIGNKKSRRIFSGQDDSEIFAVLGYTTITLFQGGNTNSSKIGKCFSDTCRCNPTRESEEGGFRLSRVAGKMVA